MTLRVICEQCGARPVPTEYKGDDALECEECDRVLVRAID